MHLDPVFLSRVQFGLTIMFHYLFPPLTIGMGLVMVYLEGMYLRTKEPIYETAAKFWTSLFAVNFAMGVATGIVMEFEFGTNWAHYSRFVGDVFGSALAAEGIFAFFLESGFLAVLVFGWDKVTPRFHFFATAMVALGSVFSAVWIIVANSWQQTPAGHQIVTRVVNGRTITRAETADFWSVVFNPSTLHRLTHTLLGAFALGAFFVMSISAWYLLKRRHEDFARRSFTGALILGFIASIALAVTGDSNGRMVAQYQPAKLAAMEGHFQTGVGDLHLFGIPDPEKRAIRASIALPGFLSFLVYRNFTTPVVGLDKVPRAYWPPVTITFFSFHIMVGLGVGMIALTALGVFLRWRGTLWNQRWVLWIFAIGVLAPMVTNELGWVTAESGRQPWIVYPTTLREPGGGFALDTKGMLQYKLEEGLLTHAGVSETLRGGEVLASIIMFSVVYALLFSIWLFVLNDKIQKGPKPVLIRGEPPRGWLASTAGRALHEESLSDAKDLPARGEA